MPPKRKLGSSVPPNAASALNYTDASGDAPNKRSRISKPLPKAAVKTAPPTKAIAKVDENGAPGEAVKKADFDHSRPEERSGIIDRRYYPAEMSNERCAMYNANEILRPMELLNRDLEKTRKAREKINAGKAGGHGDAVIHWFKRDLRIRDNTGLSKAAALAKEHGIGVIGVWFVSPQDWEAHLVSPAKCDFEFRSVETMRKELDELDIPLWIETVPDRREVPVRLTELAIGCKVKNVFCNLEFEPDELHREARLVRLLTANNISFDPQHDDCVVPPGSLKTGGGKQYAVYSPWFRQWIAHLHAHPHLLNERPMPRKNPARFREKYARLYDAPIPDLPESKRLTDEEKTRFHALWPAGEAAALDRVERFLTEKVAKYSATRNFPSLNSTGRVSVHHAAGTLAARTSVRMARDLNTTKKLDGGNEGIRSWISEVAWRDFYRHFLVNWPYIWCALNPSHLSSPSLTPYQYEQALQVRIHQYYLGIQCRPLHRLDRGPHGLPHRRRRDALPRLDRLHAQPTAHDHCVLPSQAPAPRLAPRRAVFHDAPDRRGLCVQQRRLGLLGKHGRRSAAVLSHHESVAAEREV
jgi:deoxyribodipyrimidine photo-lyase